MRTSATPLAGPYARAFGRDAGGMISVASCAAENALPRYLRYGGIAKTSAAVVFALTNQRELLDILEKPPRLTPA